MNRGGDGNSIIAAMQGDILVSPQIPSRKVKRSHKYFKGFADGIPYYDGFDQDGNQLFPKRKSKAWKTVKQKK